MSIGEVSVADGEAFVYEPVRGPRRKIEFEPQSDGGFVRIESVWNGCQWRETGREACTTVRRA